MRILVVLLMAMAICHAEDESAEKFYSGEEMVLTYTNIPSKVVHAQPLPLTLPVTKTTLKAAPVVPTPIITPGTYSSVPTQVTHAQSLSPAVMKISKPGNGIKFSIQEPQIQGLALNIEEVVPASAPVSLPVPSPMPKTTLKEVSNIPATVKTATPAFVPLPLLKTVPETVQTPTIPLHYLSSSLVVTSRGLRAFTVPAQTFGIVSHVAPISAPIPAAMPISYSTAPEISVPTFSMPVFRTAENKPQTLTFLGDITTPLQMRSIMDLSTGSFSYMNLIGGTSPVSYQLPQIPEIPATQGHALKATQLPTPQQVTLTKDTVQKPAATPTDAQSIPAVIAA